MSLLDTVLTSLFGADPILPPQQRPLKKIQRLEYEDKTFDVGVSDVYVIFSDGREVVCKVYGDVDQYMRNRADRYSFSDEKQEDQWVVQEPYVDSSAEKYRQWLLGFDHINPTKVLDDPKNPTVSWAGVIQHLELIKTEPYNVTISVATLFEELVPNE